MGGRRQAETLNFLWSRSALWVWAMSALGFGILVYAVDRGGQVWFVPSNLSYPQVAFPGALGAALPSLAHTFGFATMSALVWARTSRQAYAVCGLWSGIEGLMEVVQIPVFTDFIGLLPLHDRAAGALIRGISGTFAWEDMIAILMGGLGACWISGIHYREKSRG